MITRCVGRTGFGAVLLAVGIARYGAAQEVGPGDSSATPVASGRLQGGWVRASSRVLILRRSVAVQVENRPLRQALDAIARSAGLTIAYGDEPALATARVTLRTDRMPVLDALDAVLSGTGLEAFVSVRGDALLVRRALPAASSETGSIVGRVTEATTGGPVAGAEVFLDQARWRTTTDTVGHYHLSEVEPGNYTLTVRRLGYAKQSRRVVVRADLADTVDVVLQPKATALEELVTTATGKQRRRDLGNSITTIKADSVLRTAPIRNLTDLLDNRVPGLSLQHTSGAPGDPARIRLRGLGSIMRSNDPVVVVDGIRVYATQSAARSGNLTNLADPPDSRLRPTSLPAPSPLDQIDPNIIEKIEVFKGPSAATLYGADAANGVIVITTKRGKPGPTRWSTTLEYGRTSTLGRYPAGYFRWGHDAMVPDATLCPLSAYRCVQDSLVHFQLMNVPSLTVLGRGRRAAASLTASGGTQGLTYVITGSYDDETGLLRLPDFEVERFRTTFNREAPDWMRRPHRLTNWSVRSSVTALLGPTADVTLSASLGRSRQQRSSLEHQLATLAGTYADTINGTYYRAQSGAGIDRLTAVIRDYYSRVTASSVTFTTGLTANWRPRSWFSAVGQAGLNVIPRDDQRLLPAGLASPTDSGYVSRAAGQSLVGTFNLQGTVRRPLRWGFAFETSLGANLKTESVADLGTAAVGLVPGTSSVTGASRLTAFDAQTSSSVFGWFIEPRLSGQRISLSTGVRLDGGSAYGTRLTGLGNLLALPKLNGSWVISEEPWFPLNSLFSSLRLRGAYGKAQVQPGPADRLRLYRYGTAADPLVELTTLGNTKLRPERSTEIEGGVEADLLDGRLSLELTAYRKTQVDALMQVRLPESVNGGGDVLTNIGTVRNTGVELTLSLAPVRSSALTWSNALSYSSNRNELVELGRGVRANRAEGLVAGYPVGGRWERPILGYSDVSGDGVLQEDEVLVADSAVFVGRLYPAYTAALHSSVALFGGAVSVSGGFSYDAGATQIDEPAQTSWVLLRALADPAAPLDQQAASIMAVSNDARGTRYGVTQKVSTFRFKSFAVNYRAPASVARTLRAQQLMIALQGDNLALHSTYRGKDPDVTAWAPGEGIVDTGQLARPTTWQLRFDLQY